MQPERKIVGRISSERSQRKPMDGTGENPMLTHGYANVMLCCCCWKINLLCNWLWFDICRIVGNVPKPVTVDVVVGNDMFDNSKSLAVAKSFSKPVNELFWTSVGNPHDIGIRFA